MNTKPHRSLRINFDLLVRNERARLLAIMIQKISDIELAEDALQDALTQAWVKWQRTGQPNNPVSWILKTAYNKAIDILRRQRNFSHKQSQISHLIELQHEINVQSDDLIPDERLKLIFTCCHPALDNSSQVALTLNTICGFTAHQVAQSFLLKTPTMAQRLVRAKRKIKLSRIPYLTPDKSEIKNRLSNVLSVIYMIYNQGYYSADNCSLIETSHTNEAIHLALMLNKLLPNHAETLGLLALMYFHWARFDARSNRPEHITTLEHQDRTLWDRIKIDQANEWFKQAVALKDLGAYQIQAAISGVHTDAKEFAQTDWQQIVYLYQKLYEYLPNETVKINLAVALCYNKEPNRAWQLIEGIQTAQLDDYIPYYLAQAHIAKALNKKKDAISHFSLAMSLATNTQEKAHIKSQIELINH